MLHIERLCPLVKNVLENEIRKGIASINMMISGNDSIEELVRTVEDLPGLVDDSIDESCRVYSGKKSGYQVCVVTGKASAGKTIVSGE